MEQILTILEQYGYIALFPIAAFEGPVVALVAGFLIFLGYFEPIPVFVILILGDLIPDVTYYYIGRFGHQKKFLEKYGSKFRIVSDNIHTIDKLWKTHSKKTMAITKLAYGLSTPLLISAGLVKMAFSKFVTYSFAMSVIQYTFIVSAGYFLGQSYQLAAPYIKNAGIVVTALLIVIVAIYVYIARKARKEFFEIEQEMEINKSTNEQRTITNELTP